MKKSYSEWAVAVSLMTFLALGGCAPNFSQEHTQKALSRTQESEAAPPPIPPRLSQVPLLEVEPEKEKFFSFSARNVALKDVLYPLSKEAGFNIMWDEEVNADISVDVTFEDLTLEEALDAIFVLTDYMYSFNSPTLNVKLVETRVFELGHLPNKITSTVTVGGDVLGSIPNVGGISGNFQITGTTDPEATDLWKQVEEGIKKVISSDGKYFLNELAGMVTVTDRKRNLKMAEDFVRKLKSALERQVLIEAEVVEVTLEHAQSWGIDWAAVHSFLVDHKTVEVTAIQALGLPGSVVEFTASRQDASLVLDVLGRFGEVNVLSKPRINVMNGQTALINVGQVISYWELTGLSAGGEVGQPIIFPEQKTVLLGLTMGVTPYISSDDYVTLQVVPILTDANTWSEFQFENQTLKAPNIDIRETNTQVRIKNGETIVIGGLITSRKTDSENKVPFFGDLPLLGYFFKRKEKTEERAELVILLTPRITSSEEKEG
jgi:MSHA biogenesis protein MshL